MAKDQGLERTTVVLLSDGTDFGTSNSSRAEALAGAEGRERPRHLGRPQVAAVRRRQTLKSAREADGRHVRRERDSRQQLEPIFKEIGQQLSSEYEVTYRSLLPPQHEARSWS